MGLLHRLRPRPDAIELDVLAVVARLVRRSRSPSSPRPARASGRSAARDRCRGFASPRGSSPHRRRTGSDRRRRGRASRPPLRTTMGSRSMTRHRPVPTLSSFGRTGGDGQRDERVQDPPVLLGQLAARRVRRFARGRDVGVLGEEERLEAALLAHPRKLVGSDRLVRREGGEAEVHGYIIQSGRSARPRPTRGGRVRASATSSACFTSATSWTRKASAPSASASTFDATVPPIRSSASRPVIAPRKRLRDVPDDDRPAQVAEAHRGGAAARGCARASCRSRSRGRSRSAPRRRPAAVADSDALGEERLDVVDHVVVARIVLHRPRRAQHVHEDDVALALGT